MADVPHAGPTCPLSDEEISRAFWETNKGPDWDTNSRRAVALAVVAAERARLREVYRGGHGDHAAAQFDLACAIVDGTARDATTRRA